MYVTIMSTLSVVYILIMYDKALREKFRIRIYNNNDTIPG